ncbi:MAG: filamentous hemagglutinin family protein [Chthoniobacterales bacterium]
MPYDPNSPLRVSARTPGNILNLDAQPAAGDVQINGPGTLEILAGRDFDLGVAPSNADRTALGVTSIGNARNPFLPFAGADIIGGAGIGASSGLDGSQIHFADFTAKFLDPASGGATAARYLPALVSLLGLTNPNPGQVWDAFQQLPAEQQDDLALQIFYLVLRDAGRDRNNPDSPGFRNYDAANAAIAALFPGDKWRGNISLTSREIKTANGGDIGLFAPGGQLVVGFDVTGTQPLDQGILTEHGGNISIYTQQSVVVGTSRIFTLRGGNELIFSRLGDIAAGASSKTVQSAPPTRVLIDPQSGDIQTDLAGLATGGGIGVLNTVVGVPPGDVDLIAPAGTVDAGDAGIRVAGNLNIAAVQVLNAGNIATGGASVGTPVVAAPNLGGLTAASNAVGAQNATAAETAPRSTTEAAQTLPSIITVEVLGYGGGEGDPGNSDDDEEKKRRRQEKEKAPQGAKRPAQKAVAAL